MKFLPLVFKHLRRNRIRTISTVAAMAICIFLFCTLQSVLAEINAMLNSASANRLVTRHAVSLVFNLPLSYGNRIAGVDGVLRVAGVSWFGGSLPAKKQEVAEGGAAGGDGASGGDAAESTTDWSNFFPNMAIEDEPFLAMHSEYELSDEERSAYLADLRGCLIGRKLADKFGWEVGDTFFLESFIPPYRKPDGPFEFVVRGIFDADPVLHPDTDTNLMLFHFKYLYEGTGQSIGAGTYHVEIEDPDRAGEISQSIDTLFANSDAETRTETEKAFAASFVSMAGNLALLLNGIGLAVTFTILLVTANTMSMAVRERRTEIGVLKTLGFSSGQVMGLIVMEAVLLGLLGGAVGIGGSQAIMWALTHAPGVSDMLSGVGLSELNLQPWVALLGFGVALLLGLAAGFVPALGAYRSRITDALRTV
ncbi:MAG: ABC transporter ATP-binding protein [Gemmatimonadota bacterium]|nr:MAG: ABC transporter ATP-binding protein [Gemmatimonadota bacterium]